jgi:hypothetical protein
LINQLMEAKDLLFHLHEDVSLWRGCNSWFIPLHFMTNDNIPQIAKYYLQVIFQIITVIHESNDVT